MTPYKQGDVLLVPFPFTDQTAVKQRPAVVLSGVEYNQRHPDIILAPVTSQIGNVRDETRVSRWKAAGLLKPSAVKPILSSFDTRLVRRHLGSLTEADIDTVRQLFARILEM